MEIKREINREIIEKLRSAKKLLLVSHIYPDVDTASSMLAMKLALLKVGKEVSCYNAHDLAPNLRFLKGSEGRFDKLHPKKKFDATVLLDAGTADRFGNILDKPSRDRLGCIIKVDHHLTGDDISDLEFVDTKRSSTAELVAEIIKHYPIELDQDIAMNIYSGIVSDTGSFRYSNTNSATFKCAATMLATGINTWDVAMNLYENRPVEEIRLLSRTLTTLEVSDSGKFASLIVTRKDMQELGAEDYMLDGFVNFGRSIKGVEVSVLLSEKEDGMVKISMRSKGAVNVAEIAAAMGGGGHHNAAGFSKKGDIRKLREKLSKIAAEKLAKY